MHLAALLQVLIPLGLAQLDDVVLRGPGGGSGEAGEDDPAPWRARAPTSRLRRASSTSTTFLKSRRRDANAMLGGGADLAGGGGGGLGSAVREGWGVPRGGEWACSRGGRGCGGQAGKL